MNSQPNEIFDALNQPYGYILLIKGQAGTGKTTLALELLHNVQTPLYVSTRINSSLLYKQFPWIRTTLPETNIIDATSLEFGASPLEESNFLQTFKLQNLPDFVKILYSKINSTKNSTIVIDSWDALAFLGESLWKESSLMLSNYLLELARKSNYNLILILETQDVTPLDYLVDGIACLEKKLIYDDRRIRYLYLNKLRGIQINHPAYLFTLHQGRFTCFEPTNLNNITPSVNINTLENPPGRFSTGIQALDKILGGGLAKNTIILSETHPNLGPIHAIMLTRLVCQFIKQERGVVGIPPPGREYVHFIEFVRKLVSPEVFNKCLRHVIVGEEPPSQSYSRQITPSSPNEFFNHILDISQEITQSTQTTPNLLLISTDYLPLKFDLNEIKRELPAIANRLKKTGNLFFFTAYMGNPLIDAIRVESQYHLVVDEISGCALFYLQNPKTNFFAINLQNLEKSYNINLIPIV